MAAKSGIEWTDSTWNPIRFRVKKDAAQIAHTKGYDSLVQIAEKMAGHVGQHCEHVSPGCLNCYAESKQHRCLPSDGTGLPYDRRSRDLVEPFIDEDVLLQPLKWGPVIVHGQGCPDVERQFARAGVAPKCGCPTRPRMIFPVNQSDMFGDWVTGEMLDQIHAVMALCPQHYFQVLTKRPERRRDYLANNSLGRAAEVSFAARDLIEANRRRFNELPDGFCEAANDPSKVLVSGGFGEYGWPLPNVWQGVSVEDQDAADERIPLLLQTPAAVRYLSCEPLLGLVDVNSVSRMPGAAKDEITDEDDDMGAPLGGSNGIDWVICGGESGPGARPMHPDWAGSLRDQCAAAGVPFFFKQWGEWFPMIGQQPNGLRARRTTEFPDGTVMGWVGKHAAGAVLDGRGWKQFPEVLHARA